MIDNELWCEKFKREIVFKPAFDRRDPDDRKNYGIHGVTITFYLKGPAGVVQFVFYSGIHLPHVADELARKAANYRGWMAADIGYHSPKPLYEGQPQMSGVCEMIEGGVCYYDGSSLNAEPIGNAFVSEGEEPVWNRMAEFYTYHFEERTYE